MRMVQSMAQQGSLSNEEDVRNFMPLLSMFAGGNAMALPDCTMQHGAQAHAEPTAARNQQSAMREPHAASACQAQPAGAGSGVNGGDETFLDILSVVMDAWEAALVERMMTSVHTAVKAARRDVLDVRHMADALNPTGSQLAWAESVLCLTKS